MSATDKDLLQRVVDDNKEACTILVHRYANFVFSIALRVVGSETLAEDVTQEVFVQLFAKPPDINGNLAGWLHRVATRRAIDLIRSDASRRRRETAYSSQLHLNSNRHKMEAALDEALDALNDDARKVLTLYFLERKTMTQVAAELGISQPSVSRRIADGLEQMRQRLSAEGIATGVVPIQGLLLHDTALAPQSVIEVLSDLAASKGSAAAGAGALSGAAIKVATGTTLATGVALWLWFGLPDVTTSAPVSPVPKVQAPVVASAPAPAAEEKTLPDPVSSARQENTQPVKPVYVVTVPQPAKPLPSPVPAPNANATVAYVPVQPPPVFQPQQRPRYATLATGPQGILTARRVGTVSTLRPILNPTPGGQVILSRRYVLGPTSQGFRTPPAPRTVDPNRQPRKRIF